MTAPATTDQVFATPEMAKVLNVSENAINYARKASRILDDGTPFVIPNYPTPADYLAFFRRWPQFHAKDWEGARWKQKLDRYTPQDRHAQLVSKFGGK